MIPSERRKAERLLRRQARRQMRGEQPVGGLGSRERRFPPPKPGENRSLNGFYSEQRPHPSYPMPKRAKEAV